MAKILVVDDEREKRETIVLFLTRFGHEVVEAESGDAAVHVLADAHGRFDIIITDFKMPGMDGVEFTKYLRDVWPGQHRPTIVMISGTLPSGIPDLAFQTPVTDWTALNRMILDAAKMRADE